MVCVHNGPDEWLALISPPILWHDEATDADETEVGKNIVYRIIEAANEVMFLEKFQNEGLKSWLGRNYVIADLFAPQNINPYTYVLNNPLKYTDPSGYEPFDLDENYSGDGVMVVVEMREMMNPPLMKMKQSNKAQ